MKEKIVLMGVSGSGKSTIGEGLAAALDFRFIDADDLHSSENRRKMAGGIPLDDDDRWPWLEKTGVCLRDSTGGIVIACSALKRSYRDYIRSIEPAAFFVHLDGSPSLLEKRLRARSNHFFRADMLGSQLEILEGLAPDEAGIKLNFACAPEEVISDAVEEIMSPNIQHTTEFPHDRPS